MLAALGVAELSLRAAHFRFRAIPEVQFGWPEPKVILDEFKPDPDLLWVTRDYDERLARARAEHPAVIFLGDSCVEFSAYPRLAMERLARTRPGLSAMKLSVPGWSSEQGRAQMQRDVRALAPRLIAVEFGWNDHWDAMGPPDDQTHPGAVTMWASEHLRVYQAYRRAAMGVEMKRHPEGRRRVSLERYRENLEAMAAEGARAGARVMLITAPTSHEAGHEPAYLRARHLHDLSQLVPLHARYVDAARAAAAASGAALCDLAEAMARLGPARRRYFHSDGIHFNAAGDLFVGDFVAGCIAANLR